MAVDFAGIQFENPVAVLGKTQIAEQGYHAWWFEKQKSAAVPCQGFEAYEAIVFMKVVAKT